MELYNLIIFQLLKNMHVHLPSLIHNLIDQNMAMLEHNFYILLIFLYHDVINQCVDLLVIQVHHLTPTPIVTLRAPLGVEVQNSLQNFLFLILFQLQQVMNLN
eukprot:Amastigsp_a180525_11.p4 type:complete len:103 gc:universal Amastigsp_a180525_11:1003-1311(+)